MSFWPETGGAWGCQVNAHRAGWNGTVCNDPCNWDCGAKRQFRADYCDRGDDRCYQVYLFDAQKPWFIIDEKGAKWLLDEDARALDDQVLFLFTHQFKEPAGSVGNGRHTLAGLYVVKQVEEISIGHKSIYKVHPRKDWSIHLSDLRVEPQRYDSVGRPYMRHFDSTAVARMLDHLDEAFVRNGIGNDPRRKSLKRLQGPLENAATLNDKRRNRKGRRWVEESAGFDSPFSQLQNFKPVKRAAPASEAPPKSDEPAEPPQPEVAAEPETPADAPVAEPVAVPEEPAPAFPPLFELGQIGRIGAQYGEDVVRALWLAGRRPNAMILLRGAPGIGKSRLALSVTDEDRRHVEAVPSTWRGREDLLGYTNPMTGTFRPTPFTDFLKRAERAWNEGVRDPFVVVFEEFNLSPPEYWLSDLLVRSQYAPDDLDGRRIELGGTAPEHWNSEDERAAVTLSPALRIVGTINSDHTTRDLSPRVLDRVTLIQVELSPEAMIERLDVDLEPDELQAIKDLHYRLESRGAVFSMRTALAIQDAFGGLEELGATRWDVIDLVLVTQVLSKVRLFVGEPGDHEVIADLSETWADDWGARLPLCAERFERWRAMLESGFDVVQA